MDEGLKLADVADEGMFTVARVKPLKDADGNIQLMTCGCGCHGSVSVSNTLAKKDDKPEVLVLQP